MGPSRTYPLAFPPPSSSASPLRRPSSIAELAQRARDYSFDPAQSLKSLVKAAEQYNKLAKEQHAQGNREEAFVNYAKAATIVLEKLPHHRDYHTLLSDAQRSNIGGNGQAMLDALSELKPSLVDQYEKWRAAYPDGDAAAPASVPVTASASMSTSASASASAAAVAIATTTSSPAVVAPPIRRSSTPHTPASYTPNAQYIDPTTPRQPPQRSPRRNQYDDNRPSPHSIPSVVDEQDTRKWSSAMDAARRAADPNQAAALANRETIMASVRRAADPSQPDLQSAFQRMRIEEDRKREEEARRAAEQRRIQEDLARRQQQEMEELRRREESRKAREEQEMRRREEEEEMMRREEDMRRRKDEERRREKEVQEERRREKELLRRQQEAAEMSRASRMASLYPLAAPAINAPGPSRLSVSNSQDYYYQSSDDEAFYPKPLPLQTPARYEDDTTDSESQEGSNNSYHHQHPVERHVPALPQRTLKPAFSYPTITTTSPAPPEVAQIQYPSLMSQHQQTQGYTPSLLSMFKNAPMSNPLDQSALLSVTSDIYARDLLPNAAHVPTFRNSPSPYPDSQSDTRIVRTIDAGKELRTVTLPRDCLPRFLSIAKINTERNRETCGLLLGKDKGHKYVVTTLLIPKQHSTSDTCTMDEEELVLEFTEERSLITLGWIHTHPSQSCFMSSVDLHTHSGFQRMLPESFAVVCAPKHTPNFGIFRLTDPPGLDVILKCEAKEAFHPHADVPIYTDADRGHVQMKDAQLEIVDLRA